MYQVGCVNHIVIMMFEETIKHTSYLGINSRQSDVNNKLPDFQISNRDR